MPREVKGIIIARLFVLILIILVPIIMFLIFNLADFKLWFSDNPTLNLIIIKILCPTVFSIAWLFFLILFATRVSKTIESMDKIAGVIPIRLKLFFGANAIFVLFIFVFPIITPVIAVLSFSSMAWRLTTFRKESWEEEKVSLFTKVLMILFSILPIACSIIILPQYIILAIFLWEEVWVPILPFVFIISYCLYSALAIGSLLILISNRGISEYEQILAEPSKNIIYIRIFEIFLFLLLLFLEGFFFLTNRLEIVDLFHYIGFGTGIFVSIVNFISGKRQNIDFKKYFLGYLLAAIFMGANLFVNPLNRELSYIIQMVSLIVSAGFFIFVFFYTFIKLDESEF